jgi:hypothetical protein
LPHKVACHGSGWFVVIFSLQSFVGITWIQS